MNQRKRTDEEIDELVDALAANFVARKRANEGDSAISIDEFVSSFEQDVMVTLRSRLKEIETLKESETAPTLALSESEFSSPAQAEAGWHGDSSHQAANSVTRDAVRLSDYPTQDPSAEQDGAAARLRSNELDAPAGYEILGTLGKGGMGIVYQARHKPLNRVVAVKMILAGGHASADQVDRFQREAEAAAHLSHPNIVSVYEVGQHHGLPFFSLEFVDGKSVSELMRESTFTAKDAAELLVPVARAVDYSHSMGVLHRDLKPHNILVTRDGVPKVADFGLAKRLDREDGAQETVTGVILGTPGYLAPEQASETAKVGPHTDVYALGCILYYLMTGRPPFTAPTPFETVQQTLLNDPIAPSKLQVHLNKDLETICLKALEKDISKRYATAGEFADELQRFLDGTPILARPVSRREKLWKWCKRNPSIAALGAVATSLLVCLLFGGIISAFVINEQKLAEQAARSEAEENARLAEDQAELALDSTRMVLYEAKAFFDSKPELSPLRKNMIDSILKGVERLHTERYANDIKGTFRASADRQLGQIYMEAGAFDKALEKLRSAEEQLVVLNEDGKLWRADISQMDITLALGDTYSAIGKLDEALEQYLSLETQRTDYFKRNTQIASLASKQSMSEVDGRLGEIYGLLGQPGKSMEYMRRSCEVRKLAFEKDPSSSYKMRQLSGALSSLSETYERAGKTDEMLKISLEAVKIQEKLSETAKDIPTLHNRSLFQTRLARQYMVVQRDDESKSLLEPATKTFDQLLMKAGGDRRIQTQAADAYYMLGIVLDRLGDDSTESYRRSEEIQRELIKKSPHINNRGALLKTLSRAGRIDDAIALAEQLAEMPGNLMSCGYAACGYALLSEHFSPDDPRRDESRKKAIALTRKLIGHGYHDFHSMRETDIDFAPLQDDEEFLKMLDEEEARVAAVEENG